MMIDFRINVIDANRRTSIALGIEEFKKLAQLAEAFAALEDDLETKKDLSGIEQGALINELQKRKGVKNIIVKSGYVCKFTYLDSKDANVRYIDGPANIIVIQNEEEENLCQQQ